MTLHWLVAPIVLPLLGGCVLLWLREQRWARAVALLLTAAQLAISAVLLQQSQDDVIRVYMLGNWLPPQGIVLVLDRLAALMLFLNATLALPVLIYAGAGDDRDGTHFHALFQFQLAGINGAFLTGDLFNLFVFFEILLIASYALLVHGRTATRVRAGLQYVVLNLIGSALFLFAAGIFYGVAGTLNFADLARRVALLPASDTPLLVAAALLLLVAFGLKSALLPLHFWLPRSYAAASAPVAALFAIMSKIGIYALIRLQTLLCGADSVLSGLLIPWLLPLGLVTVLGGALGALGAGRLQHLLAYLVMVSVGTLTMAIALHNEAAMTALLFYLLHGTWLSGAMFLLAGLIDQRRNHSARQRSLAILFVIGAMALIGLPPLSGFIGKLLLLQSVPMALRGWVWGVLLVSSLIMLMALIRSGTDLFWKDGGGGKLTLAPAKLFATLALLSSVLVLSAASATIVPQLQATARQLFTPQHYIHAVLPGAAL